MGWGEGGLPYEKVGNMSKNECLLLVPKLDHKIVFIVRMGYKHVNLMAKFLMKLIWHPKFDLSRGDCVSREENHATVHDVMVHMGKQGIRSPFC